MYSSGERAIMSSYGSRVDMQSHVRAAVGEFPGADTDFKEEGA